MANTELDPLGRDRSVASWVNQIVAEGVDTTIFPFAPQGFREYDPFHTQEERVALSRIVCARLYQRTIPRYKAEAKYLKRPALEEIRANNWNFTEKLNSLVEKSWEVSSRQMDWLEEAVVEEELYIATLDPGNRIRQIYQRLETMVLPFTHETLYSPVQGYIQGGFAAMRENIRRLLYISKDLLATQKGFPDIAQVIDSLYNSYSPFINVVASLSSRAGDYMEDKYHPGKDSRSVILLPDNGFGIRPEILADVYTYEEATKDKRPAKTGCPFKGPTASMQPLLDNPAPYPNAMKAMFDDHVRLLAS